MNHTLYIALAFGITIITKIAIIAIHWRHHRRRHK